MELGITTSKTKDFSKWYREIITKTNLIKYYDISGCYILLPESCYIWDKIKERLDNLFKNEGVENVYFPLLISKINLEKESSHIEGFKAEVAWVTNKTQNEDNNDKTHDEPKMAIRPTSETSIYPFLKGIFRSYNDLPIKYNQFCNVVRWEFTDCIPFVRSREFLWNEGHCMFTNKKDAEDDAIKMINLYHKFYKEYLLVPTIMGKKSAAEKFSGAEDTYTIESFIPEAGRSIQSATSHYLGTNFAKMYKYILPGSISKIKYHI